jgi:4-hydroxybenzoate polyprenyltransferase
VKPRQLATLEPFREDSASVPLVVDLDGTLIRSDLLVEAGLTYVRLQPDRALAPFVWLLSGKAHLKCKLAEAVDLDVASLPYDRAVIEFIEEERAKGRHIVLGTSSHRIYAEQVAAHLDLFDQVLATDGDNNLSAGRKRDTLVEQFGEKGFDYIGNSRDDLPVWAAARHAYVANAEFGVQEKADAIGNVKRIISSAGNPFRSWVKALRFHQWVKNLLIFVPLLASHKLGVPDLLLNGVVAFVLFGLCASSVYLLNDLLDIADDRHHPTKRHRPFASGALSVKFGLIACPVLLALAFGGAILLLPWRFTAALSVYYGITLAYSVALKRIMMVDVIILALLYTTRIIAGTFVFLVPATFWMLAFSMFIFLSLALVKRYAEVRDARTKGDTEKSRGRGYYPSDLEMLSSLGASAAYISVLVLALYIQDQHTIALYRHPKLIWLACPLLLFWISRTWLLANRGLMHEDPVVFAIKDRMSLAVGALFGAIFWLAA